MPQALNTPQQASESDLDRTLKLIPMEVVTLYASISIVEVPWRYFPFVLYLVGLGLVPLVLWLDGRASGAHARPSQYVVRTLAFTAWALVVRWPLGPWLDEDGTRWLPAMLLPVIPFVGALLLRPKAPTQ